IAQVSGGLPTLTSTETHEESTNQINQEQGYQSKGYTELEVNSGKISIPTFVKTPEGRLIIHLEPGKFSSETSFWRESDIGKEIISKQLHDNALNEFEKYLSDNKLITQVDYISDETGYVELDSTFEFIDLNIFEAAFSEQMVDLMIREAEKEKNAKLTKINQSGQDKALQKQLRDEITKEFNNFKKETEKDFPSYAEM
ncbi:hypothetical protein D7X33_48870, partial [Butyricicoccus sp. 1XD8-22]